MIYLVIQLFKGRRPRAATERVSMAFEISAEHFIFVCPPASRTSWTSRAHRRERDEKGSEFEA